MSWETAKIEDLCTLVTSGGTPLSSVPSYYEPKEIPWLKTAEVNYCRIYETENYISKDGLARSSAKMIPENSIIIAMYGQGDTAGRVAINKIPLCTNQACCNLIINHEIADYEYVYYYLCTLYDQLVALKTGGAQPNLNAKKIRAIEIPVPDIEIQHRIASALRAYDNLIENNRKQIKLLEEVAQRLYKEWFIDLRFPGYENTPIVDGVPEGWEKTSVGKYLQVRSGYAFKSEWWQNAGHPVVKIKNIINNTVDIANVDYVAPEHTAKIPEFKLIKGDIVIAMTGATIGKIGLVPEAENLYTNQRVGKVFPVEGLCNPTPFIFCFYSQDSVQKKVLALSSSSSAQPNISGSQLESFDIIANIDIINDFCVHSQALFEKIICLYSEINILVQARDRLLPKLMSGEIEV